MPLPEDERKGQGKKEEEERKRERESAYLCFDFFHQPCLRPHGAPFIQPLNEREEEKAVSQGQVIRTEWNALQRQRRREREREQSRKGREREERWEEREEVGALSLVPLTETRNLTPEDERKE